MKKIYKILMAVFIILLIAIGAFFFIMKRPKDTVFNKEPVLGNTAGNLYNGGIFCEYDGSIYFSNMKDDGALYRMNLQCTDINKIHNDKPRYINVDANYIYYSRYNNTKIEKNTGIFKTYNTGLFRINKNGNNVKTLYKDPAGVISLYKNTISYQHFNNDTGIAFFQVQIDGKNNKQLSSDAIIPASYLDHYMYYAGATSDHEIHKLDMDTLTVSTIYHGDAYMPIATDKGIYFISIEDKYKLCRIDLNGNNKTIIVDDFVSSFNISPDGTTIYYQIDGGENNRIETLDLRTLKSKTILTGDYKEIHITSNYIFFQDFNNANVYAYEISTGILNTFDPPVAD